MTSAIPPNAASPELTGGAGHTYQDTVAAYYLAALLRDEGAAGPKGRVISVAVEQAGQGRPMDDVIVEFMDENGGRSLDLQAKRSITISAANADFRAIMAAALATRARPDFRPGRDAYGLFTEHVAVEPFRDLERLVEWAKASPNGAAFTQRFADGAPASKPLRQLRDELRALISPTDDDAEADFYRDFALLRYDGVHEGGVVHAEYMNRLQEIVAKDGGSGTCLYDRLRRLVRDGAGKARMWTRATLLAEFRGVTRFQTASTYKDDIETLNRLSLDAIADVQDTVGNVHRPNGCARPRSAAACQPSARQPHRPSRMRQIGGAVALRTDLR